jgi:hypothetical protein
MKEGTQKSENEIIPIDKLGEQHHKMIDWMLTHYTGKNLGELAEQIGYSRSYLSTVINSDMFKAEYQRRRDAVNTEQAGRIVQKTMNVAEKTLDKIDDLLEEDDEDETLDPRLLVDLADKSLARLGYAPSRPALPGASGDAGSGVVVNNFFECPTEVLSEARDRVQKRARGVTVVQESETKQLEQTPSHG